MPKNTAKSLVRAIGPRPPWKNLVRDAIRRLGGETHLQALYADLERTMPRAWLTPTWKAKVRQVVQQDVEVEHVSFGVWRRKPLHA